MGSSRLMGISSSEGGFEEVDCSAGTIVWVRRRNGSWWPGKILGSDELSACHLVSPRSGTPVKLLGREDASVDWYNLEKSKRVKAFRCGEFDVCIDKAQKSQGVPIKKREKYARREDAILHALHLETQQLTNKTSTPLNLHSAASSHTPASAHCNLLLTQEHTSQLIPRMRGLQDFGLRIAPNTKPSDSVVLDDHARLLPAQTRDLPDVDPVTSSKTLFAFKRKRTQGALADESLVKRRDRRRPLVQVLQSSAKLLQNHTLQSDGVVSLSMQTQNDQPGFVSRAKRSRCVYLPAQTTDSLDPIQCPEDLQITQSPPEYGIHNCHPNQGSLTEENTTSGSMDEESEPSRSDSDTQEEQTVLSDSIPEEPPMTSPGNGCTERKTRNVAIQEFDKAGTINGNMSGHGSHDHAACAAAEVSKWQLKGKRNIRNLMKGPRSKSGKRSSESIHETFLEGKGSWSYQRALGEQSRYHVSEVLSYDYDEDEVVEKNLMRNQRPGFGARGYSSLLKGVSRDHDRSNIDIVDSEEDPVWETDGLSQAAFRGYWDDSGQCFNPIYTGSRFGNENGSMLVDVDLKVQASYQGEHVPLVSLMSRLNGKAIIGHPIQIEPIEDGSTDALFYANEDLKEEAVDNDGSTALAPVWRTARRTAMHRIPRPHRLTGVNRDDTGDTLQYSDVESKRPCTTSHASHPDRKAGSKFDISRPTEKKCSKKPKKASLSSQKTRMLSSIAIEQKLNGKGGSRKAVGFRGGSDGLIKPESGPTTVSCIPVKLVFSRLLEAVGSPPSRPANHIISNTESKLVQGPM